TSSTVLICISTMILPHDVQGRPRVETDAVAGRDTFTSFEHPFSLPYVETILREAMRCNP
ncbi:hypothetical protein BV22DRAFT_966088, partial [Leucogyrophana mollusca]